MAIDSLARAASALIAPRLKEEGFRKRALTWNRSEFGLTFVVNIQRSQWGSRDHCIFYVNLAVGFYADHDGRFLPESSCAWPMRTRLGLVMPSRTDKSWTIDPNTDENALRVVRGCAEDLVKFGLPWLDARRTPTQLVDALRSDRKTFASMGAQRWNLEIDQLIERATEMQTEN